MTVDYRKTSQSSTPPWGAVATVRPSAFTVELDSGERVVLDNPPETAELDFGWVEKGIELIDKIIDWVREGDGKQPDGGNGGGQGGGGGGGGRGGLEGCAVHVDFGDRIEGEVNVNIRAKCGKGGGGSAGGNVE
jgi:hypothetical protein